MPRDAPGYVRVAFIVRRIRQPMVEWRRAWIVALEKGVALTASAIISRKKRLPRSLRRYRGSSGSLRAKQSAEAKNAAAFFALQWDRNTPGMIPRILLNFLVST